MESTSEALRFEKWHGLRNDFVVIDADEPQLQEVDPSALAVAICDRRAGVGADGLLLVQRDPARMVVYNADGTRPQMCGNGLRCAAGFLHDFGVGHVEEAGSRLLTIETDAGARECLLEEHGAGRVEVTVEMGRIDAGWFGVAAELADEVVGTGRVLNAGNPHWVHIGGALSRELLYAEGERMATDPRFPEGTNVEFVRAHPRHSGHWFVDVWERGCGPTHACGTGACAVARALVDAGALRVGADARIELPGGSLHIRINDESRARMRGPAARVFSGGYFSEALSSSPDGW